MSKRRFVSDFVSASDSRSGFFPALVDESEMRIAAAGVSVILAEFHGEQVRAWLEARELRLSSDELLENNAWVQRTYPYVPRHGR